MAFGFANEPTEKRRERAKEMPTHSVGYFSKNFCRNPTESNDSMFSGCEWIFVWTLRFVLSGWLWFESPCKHAILYNWVQITSMWTSVNRNLNRFSSCPYNCLSNTIHCIISHCIISLPRAIVHNNYNFRRTSAHRCGFSTTTWISSMHSVALPPHSYMRIVCCTKWCIVGRNVADYNGPVGSNKKKVTSIELGACRTFHTLNVVQFRTEIT